MIELIGNNTVTTNSGSNAIEFGANKGTFIGNGNLTASASDSAGIAGDELCFSMSGTLTATSTGWCGISADNIFVMDGAGKISAYGVTGYAAIALYDGTAVNGYKTAFGSADANEEDEANMSPARLYCMSEAKSS